MSLSRGYNQMPHKAKSQQTMIHTSEPKNEPVAQEKKDEKFDTEYANMDIPHAGTFHWRMMPCNVLKRFQWVP